jgi:dipeptidyl aminopeptidase/acylaminoacyl peptidase
MRFVLVLVLALAAVISAGTAASGAQPARRYLVTARGVGSPPLAVVEILDQSGRVERVVGHPGFTQSLGARWSPDGSMLAWIGRDPRDGGRHDGLNVERADGSGRRVLALTGCGDHCIAFSFAWSPDSRSLAVAGSGAGIQRLLVISAGTGRTVKIDPAVKPPAYVNYFVIGWSPDGRSIVYERTAGNLGQAGCCRLDVRIAAADGSGTRVAYRFPDPFYKGSFPSLSPDGRSIAYITPSDDGRNELVRVVDLRSGASHVIRGLGVLFELPPAWSRDSRTLALGRLYGEAVTIPARGGHPHRLGAPGTGVAWDRGGGIVIVRGKRSDEVWASRRGKPARFLFRIPGKLDVATIDPSP